MLNIDTNYHTKDISRKIINKEWIEMRFRKLFTVTSLLIIALDLWASEAETHKNQYNDEALSQLLENKNGTVDLSLKVSENNTKAYSILAGMGICNVYDNTPETNYSPALLYTDQNLLGTGNNLTVIFAGGYLGIDFTIPERSGHPFSLSFHTDGIFLPVDYNYIADGLYTEWDLKTPEYNVSVKLKKEIPFGLTFYSLQNLKINNYEGGASWFIKPENNITYTGAVQFGFSTIETGFPSTFTPPAGFEISIIPTLVFKPGYQSWGPDTDLFTHNNIPGGMFKTSVKFSKAPTKTTYLGGALTHYSGANLYESEKWAIGQTNMMSSDLRLSGYLPEEYRSKNAVMANLDAHYQILPAKILVFGKHDIYYDIDKNLFRQGSSLGLALKLPYEIEMNIEAGIGWNAEREDGPGWSVQIALSRFF